MARKSIEIDYVRLQQLIDVNQVTWESGLMQFLDHVADLYNLEAVEKVNGPILYTKIKPGFIKVNVEKKHRGIEKGTKLTADHRRKLMDGKRLRKGLTPFPKWYADQLRERWKGDDVMVKYISILEKKPTFKVLMKFNCLGCMGGSGDGGKTAVKACTTKICPFFPNRGWK